MKKSVFFATFLLILSFGAVLYSAPTNAETANYTISISAKLGSTILGEDYYNQLTNTLSINYPATSNEQNQTVTLTAQVTSNDEVASVPQYEWKLGDKILSTSKDLILNTTMLNSDNNLLLIGESRYILTVKNQESGNTQQQLVKVVVKGSTNDYKVITLKEGIPNAIQKNSSPFTLHAYMPITAKHSIYWMAKTPSQATYKIVSEQSSVIIDPKDLLSDQFNAGTFDFIAIATYGTTTCYSEKISIAYIPKFHTETPNTTGYKIEKSNAENTKASIEATKFSIINAENLNCDQIFWYVGTTRVATGASFIYEPLTKDTYTVTAKYLYTNPDGSTQIANLDSTDVTPNATNTWVLYVGIAITVVILSVILTISIIHTNKKRDVVW